MELRKKQMTLLLHLADELKREMDVRPHPTPETLQGYLAHKPQ